MNSRLKILINFRTKKGFLFNIAGNENPQIGECQPVISDSFTGVYQVESCLSRTRKVCTLEILAPANIQLRALQTEVELQNQCSVLKKLKSTNSPLQKELVELRQELDDLCNKTKEATKEVLGKWRAEYKALRDNLKAAAARNAV